MQIVGKLCPLSFNVSDQLDIIKCTRDCAAFVEEEKWNAPDPRDPNGDWVVVQRCMMMPGRV